MQSDWAEAIFDELKSSDKQAFAMGPFGSRIKAENFVTSGVPVIKGANLNGDFLLEDQFDFLTEEKATELSSSIAKELDLVITHRGTIGQVGIIRENARHPRYIVSQSQLKLSFDRKQVNPYFIYYFLRSPEGQRRLLMNASQVGVPAIARALTSVRKISVPLPALEEQNAVAETLLSFDDQIGLNRQINKTIEAVAQALFKSWFIDFDPIKAKIAGRQPEAMDEATAALFPAELQESEIGLIPKGWFFGTLAEFSVLNPESWSTKNHPSSVLYVDLANAKENRIEQIVKYSFSEAPSRARRALRAGDTIIGTVRPGNRSFAYIQSKEINLTGSTGFAVLRPKQPSFAEFVYLSATHKDNIARLANLADGGAYPAVRPEVVLQTPVICPNESILKAFSELVAPLFQQIQANKVCENQLAEIRDALLPKLISGQLRIPTEHEKIVTTQPYRLY